MVQRITQVEYPGDGTTTLWDFNFDGGYIDRAHVKAKMVNVTTEVETDIPVSSAMFVSDYRLTVEPAIPIGYNLVIYRATPTIPLVSWPTRARIDREGLDLTAKQGLFVAAEQKEAVPLTALTLQDAINARDAALVAASAAEDSAEAVLESTVTSVAFGAVGDNVTDDTAALNTAITWALANGAVLDWPVGTYVVTANLPSLHLVRHRGAGKIRRGTDVFYPDPGSADSNTLYVSTTGTSTNDGLTPDKARRPQQALDVLTNYGPALNGFWNVVLAAGVYTDTSMDYPTGLLSRNPVIIRGPVVGHPNMPTAKFIPASPGSSGIEFSGLCTVTLRDVYFENFTSSTSSFAVAATQGAWLRTENVWVKDTVTGITCNAAIIEVRGGIVDNCTTGLRSLFLSYHSIGQQNANDLLQGPIVKNCDVGFAAQEGSTGHSDWVTYLDNDFAITAQINARVHAIGSDFQRNLVCLHARNGNILANRTGFGPCTFHLGTADANEAIFRGQIYGIDMEAYSNANTSRIELRDIDAVTTSSTSEVTLKTYNLAAGVYLAVAYSNYLGKRMKIRLRGSLSGTLGTKTIRAKIGGTTVIGFVTAAAAGRWQIEGEVVITDRAVQRNFGTLWVNGQTPQLFAGSGTIDLGTASDLSLTVTGFVANAADAVAVDFFELETDG